MGGFPQNVIKFNYEKGEIVSISSLNSTILQAYTAINNLISDNVHTLTTGQFRGEDYWETLIYPNYCGIMTFDHTMYSCDPADSDYGLTDKMLSLIHI